VSSTRMGCSVRRAASRHISLSIGASHTQLRSARGATRAPASIERRARNGWLTRWVRDLSEFLQGGNMTTREPDFERMRQEILAYHEAFIDAHVHNNPEFLVQGLVDDYVNVSRGELVRATRDEMLEMAAHYLANTEFSEYSMPEEPEIGFSDDGSVAWSLFRLHVKATWKPQDSEDVDYEDTWACLVLLRRDGDRWIRIAEASNRIPR